MTKITAAAYDREVIDNAWALSKKTLNRTKIRIELKALGCNATVIQECLENLEEGMYESYKEAMRKRLDAEGLQVISGPVEKVIT